MVVRLDIGQRRELWSCAEREPLALTSLPIDQNPQEPDLGSLTALSLQCEVH